MPIVIVSAGRRGDKKHQPTTKYHSPGYKELPAISKEELKKRDKAKRSEAIDQ